MNQIIPFNVKMYEIIALLTFDDKFLYDSIISTIYLAIQCIYSKACNTCCCIIYCGAVVVCMITVIEIWGF